MHCFICVTYMIILTSANPTVTREISTHKPRSLFHDVIESLRLHAQLPAINQNEDNNLAQNYDRFEYEPDLQNDNDYLPRRNDRLEMPGLKYRLPKDLKDYDNVSNKEIFVYINTESPIKKIPEKYKTKKNDSDHYITNKMAGQSQIGDRKTETIIKPVIIINFKDLPNSKNTEELQVTDTEPTRNYFNIKQEINLDKGKTEPKVNENVNKIMDLKESNTETIVTCGNAVTAKETEKRKFNGVLEILFSI